ncbi:hypothetical protein ACINWC487_A0054 [Acinetobacter nosocomialis]|nr:hypothetical protein ACINWC487_A0054 [Acinetobacter nosocomialis]
MKSYCHTAGNLNRIKKLVWDSADAYFLFRQNALQHVYQLPQHIFAMWQ